MFPRIYFFKTNGNLKQTASEDMKSMTKNQMSRIPANKINDLHSLLWATAASY